MQYVKQSVASEDTVQLFTSAGVAVTGLVDTDVTVTIRKEGDASFSSKTLIPADWVDRGGGNYSIQFSASDFDTLGIFRYQIVPVTPGAFVNYADALSVVVEIPTFPPDPPSINDQTDSPPGVSPDPVEQGATLTISGSDLGGALQVTIGGVIVPITSNTDTEIQVTVTKPDVVIGPDQIVVVSTPGGDDSTTVDVVLDAADIPGSGCIDITGKIFNPETCSPEEGVPVFGRILCQPNISLGVGWKDTTVKVLTNGSGDFSISFPREFKVEVIIPCMNYRRVFTTPDLATADLFTEIPNQAC